MNKEKPMTVAEAIQYVKDFYGEEYHYNSFYRWLTEERPEKRLSGFRRGGQWRILKKDLHKFFCPENQNKPILVGVN